MPLRHHLDVQQAGIARRRLDRVVEIELFGRARPREFSQPTHGDLDIAGAELDAVIQVFEISPIPDLHRALVFALPTDTNALRVISVVTEW